MVKARGTAERYLRNLDRNVRRALEAGGMLVEDAAQEKAPINTRTMERSVSHTPAVFTGGRYQVLVGSGPEAPYAPFTELEQFVKDKQLGPKSEAKGTAEMPWLRPALEESEPQIRTLVRQAVRATRA
jgi:hypothetical protein